MERRGAMRLLMGGLFGLGAAPPRLARLSAQVDDRPSTWDDARPAPRDVRVLVPSEEMQTVSPVALSPDGRMIIAATRPSCRRLRAWDGATGRLLFSLDELSRWPINDVSLAANCSRIVVKCPNDFELVNPGGIGRNGLYNGAMLRVFDARTGEPIGELLRMDTVPPPRSITMASDGIVRFLLRDEDWRMHWHAWDPVTGAVVPPPPRLDEPQPSGISDWSSTRTIAYSSNGLRWAVLVLPPAEGEGPKPPKRLRLIDADTGTDRDLDLTNVFGHEVDLRGLAMVHDGRSVLLDYMRMLSGSNRRFGSDSHQRIALVDFVTGKLIGDLNTRVRELPYIHFLAIDPNATRAVVPIRPEPRQKDAILTVWDLGTGRPTHAFRTPAGVVRAVAFLPNSGGRMRVLNGGLGDQDAPLVVWDTPPTEP